MGIKENDFIIDEGKLRFCTYNFARMNLWQYMWYQLFHWNILGRSLRMFAKQFLKGLSILAQAMMELLVVILFPIFLPIAGYRTIKNARKKKVKE